MEENLEGIEERCKNIGGSSGAFFYYTCDNQYILKTVTPDEVMVLDAIMHKYTERVTGEVPSFLARIFGVFKIKINQASPVHVILMENLRCVMDFPLMFDLKGSTVNRRVTHTVYRGLDNLPKFKVYKDSDLNDLMINFELEQREVDRIVRSIELDTMMLESNCIMDYSMLLLIEELKSIRGSLSQRRNYARCGKYIVCIGIIDYLQAYNTAKKVENRYKSLRISYKGGISSIPPLPYRKRFMAMIRKIFREI